MDAEQMVLARRPVGEPRAEDFRLEASTLPPVVDGSVLLRVVLASADPYMRWKMNEGPSYTPPYEVGAVISGRAVCEVLESRDPRHEVGSYVTGVVGWQTHAVVPGHLVTRIDPAVAPLEAFLGVLGMPGFTGYAGLEKLGRPRPGETLVVAAALGPVGATVAQVARLRGLRVVAVVGGPQKVEVGARELGVDHVLDHRSPDFVDALADATPDGVDIYFENVGGPVTDAVHARMNLYGRIPVCGMVADYNRPTAAEVDRLPGFYRQVLVKSLSVRGFIATEFVDELFPAFQAEMGAWVAEGAMWHAEHVTYGLERAPEALVGLLRGDNLGKAVIRVG